MTAALVFVVGLSVLSGDYGRSFPYIFLLPWVVGLAGVISAPAVYYFFRGGVILHNPIVFAAWSYCVPGFV